MFFALDKAGLVAAPLSWRLTPHEVKQIVDDIKPKLIVTGAEFKAHGAATGVPTLTFDELPRGGDDPRRDVDGAVCCQFCTSGTTGAAQRRDADRLERAQCRACLALEMPEMREGGRHLVCLPLFHIGGAGWAIWAMQQGSTAIIVRETAPGPLLKTMVEQKVETALLGADADAVSDRTAARAPPISPRSSTSPTARRRSRRICCAARSRPSNAASRSSTGSPKRPARSPRCRTNTMSASGFCPAAGRCSAAASASSTPNDNDLPPYEVGEIFYQGENLMAGYWARAEATAEAMRGGWFHTGDAGYMDADGFIFLKDRIQDMIVSGGENVYPAEVEAVLMGHPEILECAVIGVPDPKWGETVKAVVVAPRRRRADRSRADRMDPRKTRRLQAAALGRFHRHAAAQRQPASF